MDLFLLAVMAVDLPLLVVGIFLSLPSSTFCVHDFNCLRTNIQGEDVCLHFAMQCKRMEDIRLHCIAKCIHTLSGQLKVAGESAVPAGEEP